MKLSRHTIATVLIKHRNSQTGAHTITNVLKKRKIDIDIDRVKTKELSSIDVSIFEVEFGVLSILPFIF